MSMKRFDAPAVSQRWTLVFGSCSLLLSATGCGTSQSSPPDSGVHPDAAVARECSVYDEGKQRDCTCSSGAAGKQACLEGKYQPCNCSSVTPSDVPLCKAGFYTGEFSGLFKPGVFGMGIIGGPFEFEVQGRGAEGYPALSFTLEEEQGGGDFGVYAVKNGCMIGSASVGPTNSPFLGRVEGELDCKTGVYRGTLAGQYDLVGLGWVQVQFSGTVSAQFSQPQARIKDGLWNVTESEGTLFGEPSGGGGGTWSAIWESAAPPQGQDPCAQYSGAGIDAGQADSGLDAGEADAGPDGGRSDAGL